MWTEKITSSQLENWILKILITSLIGMNSQSPSQVYSFKIHVSIMMYYVQCILSQVCTLIFKKYSVRRQSQWKYPLLPWIWKSLSHSRIHNLNMHTSYEHSMDYHHIMFRFNIYLKLHIEPDSLEKSCL